MDLSINTVTLLYLVASVWLHPVAQGPEPPDHLDPRQSVRHDRHGDRRADDGRADRQVRRRQGLRHGLRARRPAGRRRLRRLARQDRRDDEDARARRLLPQHDRPGGRVHRGGGGGRTLGLRHHRQGRRDPDRQPPRARARRGDRRDHLQRLGDRLRQAQRQVQVPPLPGRAGGLQGPAHPEPRARPGDAVLHLRLHGQRGARRLLAAARTRLRAGRADHHPDRRRRHAGGRLDAEQLLGLGRRGHRLLAQQRDADRRRQSGGVIGRDPELHHVQGDEPLVLQRHPGRLRRRGRRTGLRRPRRDRSRAAARTTPPSCSATPRRW